MNFKKKYLPIWVFAILAIGIYIGSFLQTSQKYTSNFSSNQSDKLFQLLDLIDREYVDPISKDSLLDLTITNLLDKLDPHSIYFPSEEMETVSQQMKGDFVGIGINFYMIKDTVAVIKTVPNGPSHKAGILPGDRILFANDRQIFGKNIHLDSLYSVFRGTLGSTLNLKIYRKKEAKKLDLTLTRNTIPIKSVDVALKINDTLGYIKISRFAETTHKEFVESLQFLKKNKIKSLVIDVRENGGGYLDQAIKIADELLSEKKLIVFTKNKNNHISNTFATDKGSFETGSLFVLIDENSASASEVLAGAIQDNDRGIVVGRRSFGKGLVQREVYFEDKSAVRLTVAKYYTPTGRSIQKPYDLGNEDYYEEFSHRFETGELYEKDSIKIADTIQFKTPKGKIVYGGGGIVPDVFVPFPTTAGHEGVLYLMKSPMVGNFVFRILDQNRQKFEGITFAQLKNKIADTDFYFSEFCKAMLLEGIVGKQSEIETQSNKKIIKNYLLAEFASQIFNDQLSYKVLLSQDPMIAKILK